MTNLLSKFELIVEHSKTEVFHFTRLQRFFNPPPLDLFPIDGHILCPKDSWKYLRFIFDRKLFFHQHINFYSNKAMLTVKYMKILSNSNHSLNPYQKCLLYQSCILLIALYGFQLWFYNCAPLSYPLKILEKIQRRATLWILGAFKTSPTFSIKAIAGLIPINLHLQKLSSRSQIWAHSLPPNHIIWSLIEPNFPSSTSQHSSSLGVLTKHQHKSIKEHLVDIDNRFNEVFPSFALLHPEFSLVIDTFSDCFSFNLFSKQKNNSLKMYIHQLDNIVIKSSSIPSLALIITDTSIKSNIAMFILHMHICNKPISKTLYHAVHIMSTEAELFAIRCSINQAMNHNDISKIIVITDSIHAAKKIFDLSSYLYQVHSATILNGLHIFFSHHQDNSIEFWKCSSHYNWNLYKVVDKETKVFNPIPLFPCKMSWDFSKKSQCDDIANIWKMTFQASDFKGKQFLNGDDNIIEPSYIKGGAWLKYFGHSNSLYTRASRAITNYALIGEYRLRFFPREEFRCPCGMYPIESRHHILHECRRFNEYWNLWRDSINHFVMFLETNLSAFAFLDSTSSSVVSRTCN